MLKLWVRYFKQHPVGRICSPKSGILGFKKIIINEVEHDVKNYQAQSLFYQSKPKAVTSYHAKIEFNLLFYYLCEIKYSKDFNTIRNCVFCSLNKISYILFLKYASIHVKVFGLHLMCE